MHPREGMGTHRRRSGAASELATVPAQARGTPLLGGLLSACAGTSGYGALNGARSGFAAVWWQSWAPFELCAARCSFWAEV